MATCTVGMNYDHIRQSHFSGLFKVGWVTLQSLCPLFSVRVNHKIFWGLVPFASFDRHFCDLATTGACTSSHHSNNPLGSAEKKSLVSLCSLSKCQGCSAGFTQREMDRQSATFIPDSSKEPIHYSCSRRRFLQVST